MAAKGEEQKPPGEGQKPPEEQKSPEVMGVMKDLGSLTVDVDSNHPVLSFGQNSSQQGQCSALDISAGWYRPHLVDDHYACGSQQGQFSLPADVEIPSCEIFTFPFSLAVQRDGRVVVSDHMKHGVFLFEADGTLVKQVGGLGEGEGQFAEPWCVCVDKEDNIIVSDKRNNRVQVFDKNLNYKHKFGQEGKQPWDMWSPIGVSADSKGNIVLSNTGGDNSKLNKLQVFRSDGTWVSTISIDGDKRTRPHGVAVTEDGHVFVAVFRDKFFIRKYKYM
ncbi:PREDICTED: tripartite motif-containing protein 2-like [Branchiostoma belcheri]|uniref:Tripartite motif-containing protein 2-like n=1 Tax=Branchiostoma belcheri TaxID=7741 RepID=A0A6P4Z6S0_BRABE|nr:PREDICTED: tripartite motif-containing protein 2-like [Branchiostoma belcheri]